MIVIQSKAQRQIKMKKQMQRTKKICNVCVKSDGHQKKKLIFISADLNDNAFHCV